MRFRGFLIGGLVGAVGAMYLMRGSRMKFGGMTSAGSNIGKTLGNTLSSMNMTGGKQSKKGQSPSIVASIFGGGNQQQQQQQGGMSPFGGMGQQQGQGLNKVSDLAQQDPYVNQQVNQILRENGESVPQNLR